MPRLSALALAAVLAAGVLSPALATPRLAPPVTAAAPAGEWVAGDLHVHTIYGHDTCVTPAEAWDDSTTDRSARKACEDPYVVGFAPAERLADAEARGLDFLALTDHTNVVGQSDTTYAGPVLRLPAYENSQPGHVQMLGATGCYSNDGLVPGAVLDCHRRVTDQSAAGEQRLADALRADGGVFQVNHPSDHAWPGRYGHAVVPDTVEVWNIGGWWFQRPFPSANDNDTSLAYWDGFLRAGHQVAATGGSDSHWRATSQFQGVGEPTTWVWVTERSVRGVLEGLRAHRTTISMEPPARLGPRVYLEADADRNGTYEAMVGDAVPPGARFRVRTENVLPGSVLRVVTEAGATETTLTGAAYEFDSPARTYVRVEVRAPDAQAPRTTACDPVARELEKHFGEEFTYCRNALVMQALSSPVYVRAPAPQAPTALTYTGATAARGATHDLAARLTTRDGAPLAGEPVTFTTSTATYAATTGADGVARVTAGFPDHGRSQAVGAAYGGDAAYLPSSTTASLVWGSTPRSS
jgi:hypothetical protein